MNVRKQRKAVAPVIATLLMIAVAVAMSVIIFMWSQGFLSQTSSSTGGQQGAQNQAAQSSISIEEALFTLTGANACGTTTGPCGTIIVRNVGAVAVNLGAVTVVGISSNAGFSATRAYTLISGTVSACGTATVTLTAAATTQCSIAKGISATLATTTLTGLASGDVVTIKVTTNVGTFAQGQFTVP